MVKEMKRTNGILGKESFLAVLFLLGILVLIYPVSLVFSEASSDWIVTLRQSPGTRAAVEGGWTRDGEPISHPGGYYTLSCDGSEKSVRIPKRDLATEPNDADYDIRIWWPGQEDPEVHNFERIDAPGSKTYTYNDGPYSQLYEVTFMVYQAPPIIPSVSKLGMIILVLLLLGVGVFVILLRRRRMIASTR